MASMEEDLLKNTQLTDNSVKAFERDFENSEMVFKSCNKIIVTNFIATELTLRLSLMEC